METIIVYVDDAEYARPLLQAAAQSPHAARTHWVLVACAPRVTHRVSKFVSNRAREQWRNKWSDKLFEACVPVLAQSGAQATTLLARGPLQELLPELQATHGAQAQVVDLRRPKTPEHMAVAAEPVHAVSLTHPALVPAQPQTTTPPSGTLRKLASVLTSVGAVWTMVLGEALAA